MLGKFILSTFSFLILRRRYCGSIYSFYGLSLDTGLLYMLELSQRVRHSPVCVILEMTDGGGESHHAHS